MSALPSFAELAGVLLPRFPREGLICVLSAYFDDSGTHGNSEIVVMAGFIGNEEQWKPFDETWAAKLKAPLPGKPALERFHMANCVGRKEAFSDYSLAESDAVIHDFRQIILDAKLAGYVMAVDRAAWDELIVGPNRIMFGDAEWFCVRSCLTFSIDYAQKAKDMVISLVFDDRPELIVSSFNEPLSIFRNSFYNGDLRFPDRPHLIGSSFMSSKAVRPLQAADMLAWESYHHTLGSLNKTDASEPREHLQRFIETGLIDAGFVDRESARAMASMFRIQVN